MAHELSDKRWAVINHNGRLQTGLSYEEASRLATMYQQQAGGLTHTVVSDETALRLPPVKPAGKGPNERSEHP